MVRSSRTCGPTSAVLSLARGITRRYARRRIENNCGDVGNSFASDCSLALDESAVDAAIESLLSTPDLETRLNRRLSNVDAKLRVMQRNIDRSRELADFLANTRP